MKHKENKNNKERIKYLQMKLSRCYEDMYSTDKSYQFNELGRIKPKPKYKYRVYSKDKINPDMIEEYKEIRQELRELQRKVFK